LPLRASAASSKLILLIKRMDAEGEMMIRELGREYLDYMGRTSRLVPRAY